MLVTVLDHTLSKQTMDSQPRPPPPPRTSLSSGSALRVRCQEGGLWVSPHWAQSRDESALRIPMALGSSVTQLPYGFMELSISQILTPLRGNTYTFLLTDIEL